MADDKTFSLADMFSNHIIVMSLWFLATYLVAYFVLGIFFKSSINGPAQVSRMLDIIVLLFVVIYALIKFSHTKIQSAQSHLYDALIQFKEFADNPYSMITVVLFLAIFYGSIYLVRIPMSAALKPLSILFVESVILIIFVILLIVDFFKYLLKVDLLNFTLDGLVKITPASTEASSKEEEKKEGEEKDKEDTPAACETTAPSSTSTPNEVFNIRNNLYSYDEAQEVCSIYGAKLATYDQIEAAYNDGGEWCNYGWSEGQLALFPTQKATWNKLQESKKAKNACGRPGVNGGFIKNPKIRFGVNCYGVKPAPSAGDQAMMNANVELKIPESPEDKALKAKVDAWKQNADKFLQVNSFNRQQWSERI
jgi:hypothetical protein